MTCHALVALATGDVTFAAALASLLVTACITDCTKLIAATL